jgi:hypothetical protein
MSLFAKKEISSEPPKRKILQIIPAGPGWEAVWVGTSSNPCMTQPIVCWALVEEPPDDLRWDSKSPDQVVIGMARNGFDEISLCSGSYFLGYAQPGANKEDKDYFLSAANEKLQESKDRRSVQKHAESCAGEDV